MRAQARWGLLLAITAALRPAVALCPPLHFDTAHDLEVPRFFVGTWYLQLQASRGSVCCCCAPPRGLSSQTGDMSTDVSCWA